MASVTFVAVLVALLAYFVGPIFLRPQFPVHKEGAILITGASTGIGLDAALALNKLGFTVFGTVRNDRDRVNLEVRLSCV
jgi:NADPH:quinone reductase-like Zn-dependent oxidoreductase